MTIFEKVLEATTLRDIVDFLRACEADEKTGREPDSIAWSMTYLQASDYADKLYHENKYPALTRIMDLTPELEIKNASPMDLLQMWAEIKRLINELDQQAG